MNNLLFVAAKYSLPLFEGPYLTQTTRLSAYCFTASGYNSFL